MILFNKTYISYLSVKTLTQTSQSFFYLLIKNIDNLLIFNFTISSLVIILPKLLKFIDFFPQLKMSDIQT